MCSPVLRFMCMYSACATPPVRACVRRVPVWVPLAFRARSFSLDCRRPQLLLRIRLPASTVAPLSPSRRRSTVWVSSFFCFQFSYCGRRLAPANFYSRPRAPMSRIFSNSLPWPGCSTRFSFLLWVVDHPLNIAFRPSIPPSPLHTPPHALHIYPLPHRARTM